MTVASFVVTQATDTQVTPNLLCVAAPSRDVNDTTQFAFEFNKVPLWSPSLSAAQVSAILGSDTGNGVVMMKAGLMVELNFQSGGKYITQLSGTVIDSNTQYPITGLILGMF